MRELPLDFAEKAENYVRIAAKNIYLYNIVEDLCINLDETNVHYIQHKNKTRAKKGAKRIRLCGKGSDKAQITVTLGLLCNYICAFITFFLTYLN